MCKSGHSFVHIIGLVSECGSPPAHVHVVFVGMRMSVHVGLATREVCVCRRWSRRHCLPLEGQRPPDPTARVPESQMSGQGSRRDWLSRPLPSNMPQALRSVASFQRTLLEVLLFLQAPDVMVETVNWKRQLIPKGKHFWIRYYNLSQKWDFTMRKYSVLEDTFSFNYITFVFLFFLSDKEWRGADILKLALCISCVLTDTPCPQPWAGKGV